MQYTAVDISTLLFVLHTTVLHIQFSTVDIQYPAVDIEGTTVDLKRRNRYTEQCSRHTAHY